MEVTPISDFDAIMFFIGADEDDFWNEVEIFATGEPKIIDGPEDAQDLINECIEVVLAELLNNQLQLVFSPLDPLAYSADILIGDFSIFNKRDKFIEVLQVLLKEHKVID